MSLNNALLERAAGQCELCGSDQQLDALAVPPDADSDIDRHLLACQTCRDQIEQPEQADPNHWRCLNDSMWKPVPAVQVMSWRMLRQLSRNGEDWAMPLLDMLYLDEATQAWAEAGATDDEDTVIHRDTHGQVLQAGDSVILTQDLNVKGAGFTAKRGTAVRNISLVADNPEQIEGRVNGQQIVILTRFVKKS